jgi:hypothetical protein
LDAICRDIDKAILEALPSSGLMAYGLCELVTKDKQPHPVTYDVTRKQAQIHDRYDGIFYHRVMSSEAQEDEEMSFGLDIVDRTNVRLRTFIAYKVKLGEKFILDFKNAIPKKIEMEGYKFIHRSTGITINTDHEAVYNQEYGETTPYEKHRTPWNIYALEYNLEFIQC